jgi:hypothetical protein
VTGYLTSLIPDQTCGEARIFEVARQAAALQAGRRMIARGDRPAYRVTTAQVGSWTVDALSWLSLPVTRRREALDEARAAIAARPLRHPLTCPGTHDCT